MKLRIYTALMILLTAFTVKAQDAEQPLDTLTRHVAGLSDKLEVLKRIKVSGYMQAQYQIADSVGAPSYAGGNFASGVDKRFMLRRARVKIQYDAPGNDKGISTSQYVFQLDVSEKGATIKDMYAKFTDPWIGWFSLTAGMQNRPFGYEIGYSSSLRESPERGRMSQIIFPGERDLGAMISIQGPKTSNWNWLKIDAGMFNGVGGPSALATANEFDKFKDFIAHAGINKTTKSEKIKWGLGASVYNGGYRIDSVNVFKMSSDSTAFVIDTKASDNYNGGRIDSRNEIMRTYMGFDAQFSIDWIAGLTTLRGEYILGEQPGTISSSTSMASASTTDFYKRKFNGLYFYFLQNVAHTPFQAIVKYDLYDPNTDVSGDEIGKAFSSTGSGDIAYSTVGLGLAYRWDANVKLTAYYDMVTNETSSNLSSPTPSKNFGEDQKDNVFTLRVQIKF